MAPKVFELQLAPWSRATKPQQAGSGPEPTSSEPTPVVTSTRDLVFGLLELAYPIRMRLFVTLQLLESDDEGASDSELVKRAISRARDRGQLPALEQALQAANS